jgi:uncharacterized protein HemX
VVQKSAGTRLRPDRAAFEIAFKSKGVDRVLIACHLGQLLTRAALLAVFAAIAGGCSSAGGKLGTLQTQNRSLLEQNRVQLAEIENLKTHTHRLEDKLIDAERQLAELERNRDTSEKRLAGDASQPSSLFESRPAETDRAAADGGDQRRN